jgi:hypothetical protein
MILPSYAQNLDAAADSLEKYFNLLAREKDDKQKEQLNEKIVVFFKNALEQEQSFEYVFSSLKYIGDLRSDDNNLRIITWNLPYADGTHQYFGFIQYQKNRRTILTYELSDQSEKIKNPEDQILSHQHWYGALYYQIVVQKHKRDVYYTLLGYDLHDLYSKKKLVEILHFDKKDNPVFGAPVFKNNRRHKMRLIFEYSAEATMALNYDPNQKMIVYDHLSPFRPSLKGQYQFYGPDFSYDGLKFENGVWNTYQDIDVRNLNIE